MLKALERAGLLALINSKGLKLDCISKPEKIYCGNTNLMHALVPRVNEGVSRETYFYNQVSKDHVVTYTGVADFVVDGKWTFEVGGKSKSFSQIADLPNSYVVNDDTAVGRGNRIPLWLFGFLYRRKDRQMNLSTFPPFYLSTIPRLTLQGRVWYTLRHNEKLHETKRKCAKTLIPSGPVPMISCPHDLPFRFGRRARVTCRLYRLLKMEGRVMSVNNRTAWRVRAGRNYGIISGE